MEKAIALFAVKMVIIFAIIGIRIAIRAATRS